MRSSNVYLMFNGNCREAVLFYAKCFGVSEPEFMPYGAAPAGAVPEAPKGADAALVMHVEFKAEGLTLMASDCPASHAAKIGDNFSIALACSSKEEQDKLYAALSVGGRPTMPLQEAFWGDRFGMLQDKFSVNWMLSFKPNP